MIIEIKKEVFEAVINQMNTASKDETRYHLNGVALIPQGDNIIHIVATDGHAMSVSHFENNELAQLLGDKKMLIRKEMIPQIKALLRSNKYLSDFTFEVLNPGEDILLQSIILNTMIKLESIPSFPNFKSLIPTQNLTHAFSIDAELLLRAAKAVNDSSKKSGIIKIKYNPNEPQAPMLLMPRNADLNSIGVVMPCRL